MDLTILAMLITVVIAILAPLITAIIQSRSALKLKSLELTHTVKAEAYNEFFTAYSEASVAGMSVGSCRRLIAAIGRARLYSPGEFDIAAQQLQDMFLGLDEGKGIDKAKANELFNLCVHSLCMDTRKNP